MRRRLMTAVAIAVLATSTLTAAASAQPPTLDPTATVGEGEEWIVFYWGTSPTALGVFLVRPDGSGYHQIPLEGRGELALGSWSPDGQKIVMSSRDTPGEQLYEYDVATGALEPIELDCGFACNPDEPAYAPDGASVAFTRNRGPCGVWVGDLASGATRQLTSSSCRDRPYFPRWSPDGSQLTYWVWRESADDAAVFVIDADGTDERQLTAWEDLAGDPDWSSDGEWLVYDTYPLAFDDPAVSNLYRMHPDGTGVEQLTFNTGPVPRATQPRWAPDGSGIVFTSQEDPATIPEGFPNRTARRMAWIGPDGEGMRYVNAEPLFGTHPELRPVAAE